MCMQSVRLKWCMCALHVDILHVHIFMWCHVCFACGCTCPWLHEPNLGFMICPTTANPPMYTYTLRAPPPIPILHHPMPQCASKTLVPCIIQVSLKAAFAFLFEKFQVEKADPEVEAYKVRVLLAHCRLLGQRNLPKSLPDEVACKCQALVRLLHPSLVSSRPLMSPDSQEPLLIQHSCQTQAPTSTIHAHTQVNGHISQINL